MAPIPVLGSGLSCRPRADLYLCCMAVKQGESQLIADLSEKSHQHQVCLLSAEVLGTPLLALSVLAGLGELWVGWSLIFSKNLILWAAMCFTGCCKNPPVCPELKLNSSSPEFEKLLKAPVKR